MKKLFLFLFASLLSISMFAEGETGKTKAQAIPYDWGTGIYVSSEAGVGKWYVVNLLNSMDPAGPFNANGKTDDGKTDINITIVNPLDTEVDINCTAYIGDNETSRQFKMAAGGSKSMTFGAGMFVRMGINEVYLYLVTDVTVTPEEATAHEAVNVEVQTVEANSVSFVPVDFDWTGFGLNTPAAGNEIAKNKETWLKIDWGSKVQNGYTFKLYAQNLGSAATTVDGGLATDCPATNIQEQSKAIGAGKTISKVLDEAMLDMIPGTIYVRLKADQKLHVWAEQVAPVVPEQPLFNADDAIAVSKNVVYNIASDSVVYKANYATLIPDVTGENAKYYAVQVIITNNGGEDAVVTGKVAKNVSGNVSSAVKRSYTIKAGKSISKKLDKTLLSNMGTDDEAFALVLKGSNVSFLLKDTCLEENPCVPVEAIDMTIPAAGSSVVKDQAAGTKWYAVNVAEAKAANADIELTMTAASEVDLTVDIAAACAIGEPTQSYTGSSASTTKTLSYSLFENSNDVVYVRVKSNKAIEVEAKIIDLVKYTDAGWNQTPSEDKAARIEADLEITGTLKVLGVTLAGGNIHILNGGKLIVGAEGIKGYENVDQIIVEDGGILLIKDATSNNKPFVTAKKQLHFGASVSGARRAEKHEFIALPIDNREAMAGVWYATWNYATGWFSDGFNKSFVGYDVYAKSGDANFGDYTASFKGQLASNKNQSLVMPGYGWHAFGNSWLDAMDIDKVLAHVGNAEAALHVYVANPGNITGYGSVGMDGDEKLYIPLSSAIASATGMTKLAALQGFFLYTESATTATLKFADLDEFATSTPAPKRAANNNNMAAAVVRGGNQSDFTYMIEGEDANVHKMMSNGLALYAEDGLAQVANDNLIGTTLTLRTNNATEYTLNFTWLKGETMYLKDLVNGNIIAMTEDTQYTFNAEPNTTAERFQVVGRNNETTGMENSAVIDGVNKRIENGHVVIIKNGVKYNVLGAQL